jgi:hypothetical protein
MSRDKRRGQVQRKRPRTKVEVKGQKKRQGNETKK